MVERLHVIEAAAVGVESTVASLALEIVVGIVERHFDGDPGGCDRRQEGDVGIRASKRWQVARD